MKVTKRYIGIFLLAFVFGTIIFYLHSELAEKQSAIRNCSNCSVRFSNSEN